MMAEYITGSLKNIKEIKQHIQENDLKKASKCAHEIKGMAYDENLFRIITDLESSLRLEDKTESSENTEILEKELKNFSNRLGIKTES